MRSCGGAYLLFATASWAIASVLTKAAIGELPPCTLFLVEVGSGAAALWIWILLIHPVRLELRKCFLQALPGLLQPGVAYLLTFVALQWTTVSSESVVWSTESVTMLLLGRVFFGQRFSRVINLLAVSAFLGVILVVVPSRKPSVFELRELGANLLIVVAVFSACTYNFLAERSLTAIAEEPLFALHQTAAFFMAVPFAVWELYFHGSQFLISPAKLIQVSLAGLMLFAFPFVLFLRAIRMLGSASASQALPLVPVFAAVLAVIFLHERLGMLQYIGMVMVIGSVIVVGILVKG